MGGTSPRSSSSVPRPLLGVAIVLLLLIATAAVAVTTVDAENRRVAARRSATATLATAMLQAALSDVTAGLRGLEGIVQPDGAINLSVFSKFASAVQPVTRFSAMAYERVVPDAQRAAFEILTHRAITDRSPDGKSFVRAGNRDEYFPVTSVWPSNPNTRMVLGFDVSQDERGVTARLARNSGTPQITGPIALAPPNPRPGFLLVFPIVREVANTSNRDTGFVTAAFAGADVAALLRSRLPMGTGISVTDHGTRLFSLPGGVGRAVITQTHAVNRVWTVTILASDTASHATSWAVLSVGAFLALLVTLMLVRTVRHESALARSDDRMRTMAELTGRLSAAQDTEQVGDAAVRTLLAALGTDLGGVAVFDTTRRELQIIAARGIPTDSNGVFPTVPLPTEGPTADAIDTRTRVTWSSVAALGPWSVAAQDLARRVGVQAGVHQPLIARGRVVGLAMFSFRSPHEVDEAMLRLLDAAAPAIAEALVRASLFEVQERASATFQNALMERVEPATHAMTTATIYRPAVKAYYVGGDWYDIITLPRGMIGIAVGDAVGRGIGAAAVMGQLRAALAAIAQTTEDPTEVVNSLDQFSRSVPGAMNATVCYAVHDPHEGVLQYAAAGHPPPLVVRSAGAAAAFLDDGRSTPLGAVLDRKPFTRGVTTLLPGDTLLLYTDGLIERRSESLDVGLARLQRAGEDLLAEAQLARGLHALVDAMVAGTEPADDLAAVAIRLEGSGGERFVRRLPAEPTLLQPIRHDFGRWLTSSGVDHRDRDDLVLALGEALANAIEHGYRNDAMKGQLIVDALLTDDGVSLEVRDFGTWHRGEPNALRNRGLRIIRSVVDQVDINRSAFGTTLRMHRALKKNADEPRQTV